jgi:hypothetical protein
VCGLSRSTSMAGKTAQCRGHGTDRSSSSMTA